VIQPDVHLPISSRRAFLKQFGFGVAGLTLAPALPAWAKSGGLPRSTPEAVGVASGGLLDFVNAVETQKLHLHSLMVLKRGRVIAEGWWAPYAAPLRHTLYSLSKSFTSTAVGLAVAEGKLTVEDKVVSHFPDDLPATVSPNLAAMRVKDLLTMNTGHAQDTTGRLYLHPETTWARTFLSLPVEHAPGTFFTYNSGATFMLSALVQKLTGQTVLAYLRPRLFGPLGIEGADWETNPQGISVGGWGLRVRTEDIAKFGQLYLQKGTWNGKRILPEAWIAEATAEQVPSKGGNPKRPASENDWVQGYGYQFWRCRNEAYRGDGAFGQYCVVLPKDEAVVAITSETGDMQAILDALWQHALPALHGEGLNGSNSTALRKKMASLTLPLPSGELTSPTAAQVSGKSYALAENAQKWSRIAFQFGPKQAEITLRNGTEAYRIPVGLGRWLESKTTLSTAPLRLTPTYEPTPTPGRIAASGAWTDPNTFVMTGRFIETAHYDTLTCRFDGPNVRLQFRRSLSVLNNTPDGRGELVGTWEA
jgi:CubicO group peptidase (beta-lactamase class C family)